MWKDNRRYSGGWHNGLMEGFGVYVWSSGFIKKYEGEFKQGVKEGKGILCLADGRQYKGVFKQNKLQGEVQEIMPSGRTRLGKP